MIDYSGGALSAYQFYLPKVNQRLAIQSDFAIDLQLVHNIDNGYTATVEVENVDPYAGTNLTLCLVVTESKLDINWGLGDYVNYTNRLMIPDQYGTNLDFSGGNVQTVEHGFDFETYWDYENCELIAFVQDDDTKEVLQCTLTTMAIPDFNLDAELFEVLNIPASMCAGILEPEVTIKNKGAEILTSANINFEVNSELVHTYPWAGSLAFTEKAIIEIPEFTFNSEDNNDIIVYISDANGGADENPDNNSREFTTTPSETAIDTLVIFLRTDDHPQENTWKVFDAVGAVIGEGGPYTIPQQFLKDTIYLTTTGCHQFVMYDAGGDGLSTYYTLRAVINGSLSSIFSGGAFGFKEATHFNVEDDALLANFSGDPTDGCEELTVDFSDNSFGDITSWDWTFEGGDPVTSNEENPTVYYGIPGVYDVTLTVSDGTNSDTMVMEDYIELFEMPDVQFSEIDDMCIYWPAYELTEGTPESGTYSGPGVEDGWFYPVDAGTGTHTLTYSFMDANACENSAQQTVYVDDCVGISEPSENLGLEVYPNPLTSNSTIRFNLENNEQVIISLYNSLGMEVMKADNEALTAGVHNINLNISRLENGIYFIHMEAGQKIFTQKVIILK